PCSDPYPDWAHPTAEECLVVHDLLMGAFPEDQHSRFIQPDTVPPPSEFVAGCGEVPTILDAMLRTLLSAATSKRNSSSAFQGLVKRFGLQESGPCKGSVDWTAIRHATLDDVFEAIKTGGLAKNKSQNMKAILDMVYSENGERCKAHTKVIEDDDPSAAPDGADPSNLAQMKAEIDLFNKDILTLDYYHLLAKDDALMAMQKYPGIGVKTAACVALFCMQKPCFAVDTHVFRLCRYLGWVPPKDGEVAPGEKKRPEVNEVNTFKHCEVRIPENLKYGLHQLFWNHGNNCGRCRAITGETSEGWADANCPIEHLVKRYGEKKGG
ncbi:DNA glycosylase, partial [Usnea florida]